MKKISYLLIAGFLCFTGIRLFAQNSDQPAHPTLITRSEKMIEVPSIASQIANGTFIPAKDDEEKEFNPKHWGHNTSVPGKGLPKGNDPLWIKQEQVTKTPGRTPILNFDAASATATPTDPTGAVGPNHFVNSWNTSFRIWDKTGTALTAAASLSTILPGTAGDPIVIYDPFADRFLITEFYSNGFDVAISKGANPVTSGWYVYRFATNTFPDYPKFSVWSDGYYITANKDAGTASTSQVVFALERDKMIAGNTSAQMIGFPLTGIITSGFFSPAGFNANGPTMPPVGNAPIVYMQDDAWSGVTSDHLKIWTVNVNWTTPASSTISSPQVIPVTPFDGLFDAGSFSNLPQPSGSDIDCLQATIMYMAQYRRFPSYNTVVFNFVVDLNGADNKAGIRWYELRQTTDGQPWSIYQEGTYSQPNGHSAFAGNMCMDIYGNIGLAYTVVSSTQNPSLRFTGRYASDPLGTMTLTEDVIINGASVDPSSRYGDYSQMTIDPVDGRTFWTVGEYFSSGRKNRASTFQIALPTLTAQFSGTPTAVCAGSSVVFTDQSLASPTSWVWSFPGGTPSSYNGQTPPAITYNTPGTYDVSLTVSDGTNTDPEVKTGYITVNSVVADFTATPTTVELGNTVTFTNTSACSPVSWSWAFSPATVTFVGGTSATSQNPQVQFLATGQYSVTMTATNSYGSNSKVRTNYINAINCKVSSFPWTEGFENGGAIPNCWTQEQVSSSGINYVFVAGNGASNPATAHGGSYDACLKDVTTADNKTRLISPPINLSGVLSPVLTFWHTQAVWSTRQDQLSVYYRTSSTGTWTLLITYTASVTAWTQRTISLPNGSSDYYIAFEGNAKYGRGVCIDDVQISCTAVPVSVSIAASANPVCAGTGVTYTATPANGGTTPAYQWKVNGSNAGTNNATFTYTPVTGDQVSCVLTSSALCITGNPATSGTISMTVNPVLTLTNSITTPETTVCAGTPVTVTCNHNFPVSSCDWYVNGSIVSHDMELTYVPVNNDDIMCVCNVTTGGCWSAPTATSNSLTMTVNPLLPVSISIAASANPVDQGTQVTFTATPVNEGTSPAYQWIVNSNNADNAINAAYTYTPVSGDQVLCVLTSNALCTSGNPANSNTISMVVNTQPPAALELQGITVAGTQCFAAAQTITVAGNGTSFTVQDGGSATMIAGENIFYYPGTVVEPGGYLYGAIAPGGPWCPPHRNSDLSGIKVSPDENGQPFRRIYPNPTTGVFTLEPNNSGSMGKLLVEIYDMNGQKLLSKELTDSNHHDFSLSGHPAGIYLIRVISGTNSGTARIVKQ